MDDKVFYLLDELFNTEVSHTNIIDYDSVDKFEDDESYIFTIQFKINVNKEDINISAFTDGLQYNIFNEMYRLVTLQPIVPELTKVTLKNNILDIVLRKDTTGCYISKSKIDVIVND